MVDACSWHRHRADRCDKGGEFSHSGTVHEVAMLRQCDGTLVSESGVRRRNFLVVLGGAGGWVLVAHAQQKSMSVVGYLSLTAPGPTAQFLTAFRQGLAEAGYVDTKNVTIEFRWAENQADRLPELAADLIARNVDVIVTAGGPLAALAVKQATTKIPIVFNGVGDPLANGLVSNLARPGGNVTGLSILVVELNAKRFELLSELLPKAKVIALIVNPASSQMERIIRDVQDAAHAKGRQLLVLKAGKETEIEAALASVADLRADGLLVGSDPVLHNLRGRFVALASLYRVPTIYEFREAVEIGGLISYGPSQLDFSHRAGVYAGRILNGEKPGDLPVQQPTKIELVVNLKTAKALGLAVPASILARADEVIE
jgi:putative ABC transport system substrate-binding protein